MFEFFKNPFKKPQELWSVNSESIRIEYPILCFDPNFPHDSVIMNSVEEVCGDIDFWGYEWHIDERIIDCTGKVFMPRYEIDGSWHSGTFPGKVESEMEFTVLRKIVSEAVAHRVYISESRKAEAQNQIQEASTIAEIFKILDKL